MCLQALTPVNNSAAEVSDCAVTQLLYTYPSNDLIGAVPGKNMKKLCLHRDRKCLSPSSDGTEVGADKERKHSSWTVCGKQVSTSMLQFQIHGSFPRGSLLFIQLVMRAALH